MKVEDIMTKNVVACAPSDKVEDVVRLMGEKGISGLPVVEGDRIVGIVTEGDILKLLAVPQEGTGNLWLPTPFEVLLEIPVKDIIALRHIQKSLKDVGECPVSQIMSRDVITVEPGVDIEDAAQAMVRYRLKRLPVASGGKLVGIVTRDDIIRSLGGRK